MKRSPRLTQGFTRTLNSKLERFIRVNPTAVELIRKKNSLGPQNGKWLKRASFIPKQDVFALDASQEYVNTNSVRMLERAMGGTHGVGRRFYCTC